MDEAPQPPRTRGTLLAAVAAVSLVPALVAMRLCSGPPDMQPPVEPRERPEPATRTAEVLSDPGPIETAPVRRAEPLAAHAAPPPAVATASECARAGVAIEALALRLASGSYERRGFEAEARARAASLSAPALRPCGADDPGLEALVARATLVRLAPAAPASPLDSAQIGRLRSALRDEGSSRAVVEQSGAALAWLGDPQDRAELIARAADVASPGSAPARVALECLAGPGAGLALVDAAAEELASGGSGPLVAVAATWARTGAASLAPDERAACAARLSEVADRADLAATARARALGALRAVDPDRAAAVSRAWLSDPRTDAALERAACASVREGRLDAADVLALASDTALSDERRLAIASAFAGSAKAGGDDAVQAAFARAVARELGGRARDEALQPREFPSATGSDASPASGPP